jgi:hypothetical protein
MSDTNSSDKSPEQEPKEAQGVREQAVPQNQEPRQDATTDPEFWKVLNDAYKYSSEEILRYGKWLILFSVTLLLFSLGEISLSHLTFGGAEVNVPPKWIIVLFLLLAELGFIGMFTLVLARISVQWAVSQSSPYEKIAQQIIRTNLNVDKTRQEIAAKIIVKTGRVALFAIAFLAVLSVLCGVGYLLSVIYFGLGWFATLAVLVGGGWLLSVIYAKA